MTGSERRAAFSQDRTEKRRLYREMTLASAPMLAALCMDLEYNATGVYKNPDRSSVVGYFLTSSQSESMLQYPSSNALGLSLSSNGIPFASAPYTQDFLTDLTNGQSGGLPARFRGVSSDQIDTDIEAYASLVDTTQHIVGSKSFFASTQTAYASRFAGLDERFGTRKGSGAIIDGSFSAVLSGAWLSQQEIDGKDDFTYSQRLLKVLDSGVPTTSLTRLADLGSLAQLGAYSYIPERQITVVGDSLAIDQNVVPYMGVVNRFTQLLSTADTPVHNFKCPFAVPLGSPGTEESIDLYKGSLPEPVMDRMRRDADIPGTTQMSRSLGIALRPALT